MSHLPSKGSYSPDGSVLQIDVSRHNRRDTVASDATHGNVEGILLRIRIPRSNQIAFEVWLVLLEVFLRDNYHFSTIAPADELGSAVDGSVDYIGKTISCFSGLPSICHRIPLISRLSAEHFTSVRGYSTAQGSLRSRGEARQLINTSVRRLEYDEIRRMLHGSMGSAN
jgi:hypothetical protein